MVLADYGADVIKVEEPGAGDGTRAWGPPWVGDQSAYFLAANRNKRSITVDLKTSEGRQIIHELAAHADVVIENFKVGGAAKLGIDYVSLAVLNPRLVYCSITGYGQTGPYKERAGYDFIIQAQGGVMSITGPEAGEPYKVGVAIADITTGLFAASAILAALHERTRSGKGQAIDVALLDSQIAWLANVAQNYLATGEPPARYGNAHPSIVPYESFPTADGYIAVGIGTDGQYRKFCATVGRPDLADDARFAANAARVEHRAALIPQLQAIFITQTTAAWLELFNALSVPAGPSTTWRRRWRLRRCRHAVWCRRLSTRLPGASRCSARLPNLGARQQQCAVRRRRSAITPKRCCVICSVMTRRVSPPCASVASSNKFSARKRGKHRQSSVARRCRGRPV
jgi:crotonobetainyl-CoA:carnitine CoA-transferase CaiB-like acyl-CoA transferase